MPFLARPHPRLSAAAVFGIAVGILVPADTLVSKILIGWNAGVWTYLVLMLWLTRRAKAEDVKRIAEVEDENAGLVLCTVCIAAIASLATITFELVGSKDLATSERLLHYGFTGLTDQAVGVAAFTIGSHTFAIVAAASGVQLIGVTAPSLPPPPSSPAPPLLPSPPSSPHLQRVALL